MNLKSDTVRFSISLPKALFVQMEADVSSQNYQSRSEYIRDLFRDKQVDELWDNSDVEVIGVLSVIFDHHQKGLTEKLVDLQHHQNDVAVLCATHLHINHDQCLESIILKGKGKQVVDLVSKIGALKGVSVARLAKVAHSLTSGIAHEHP